MSRPSEVLEIPVGRVHPNPGQPRKHFDLDALRSLGNTIEKHGQAVPVIVRPHPKRSDHYEIIAGERRWRAIRDYCSGTKSVRAIVIHQPSDAKAFRLSFIENEHREQLHPLERAEAMQRLLDDGLTQVQIAEMVGRTDYYVSAHLSLLRLHPGAKRYLDPALPERKRIPYTTAVVIARAPRDQQEALARKAAKREMGLKDVQAHVEAEALARPGPKTGRQFRPGAVLRTKLADVQRLLKVRFSYAIGLDLADEERLETEVLMRETAAQLVALADRIRKLEPRRTSALREVRA